MSRGFVKEDDQEEAPIIPPRAALPPNEINYVTEIGFKELETEREELQSSIKNLNIEDERERRRELAVLNGKLNLLQERIISARVLNLDEQVKDEVRFGAKVEYQILPSNKPVTFQIVGVDEADVKKQKIAFVAPIAKAIIGAKKNETVPFQLGNELRQVKIISINYQ